MLHTLVSSGCAAVCIDSEVCIYIVPLLVCLMQKEGEVCVCVCARICGCACGCLPRDLPG